MIKFNYVIGDNLELFIDARFIAPEPDINYPGGVELMSIKTSDGTDVDISDLWIGKSKVAVESLESLLEQEAYFANSQVAS